MEQYRSRISAVQERHELDRLKKDAIDLLKRILEFANDPEAKDCLISAEGYINDALYKDAQDLDFELPVSDMYAEWVMEMKKQRMDTRSAEHNFVKHNGVDAPVGF
jgi:hypothetical protein